MAERYDVYSGDDLVLEIEDVPGVLVSISAPQPLRRRLLAVGQVRRTRTAMLGSPW